MVLSWTLLRLAKTGQAFGTALVGSTENVSPVLAAGPVLHQHTSECVIDVQVDNIDNFISFDECQCRCLCGGADDNLRELPKLAQLPIAVR